MEGEIIAIIAIVCILGGAVFYIIKAKKKGQKCIGCPSGCACGKGKTSCGCCGCDSQEETEQESAAEEGSDEMFDKEQ